MTGGAKVTWVSATLLVIGFAALLVIVFMTFRLVERAQIDLSTAGSERNLAATAVQMRNGFLAAESSQRGYIATGNEIYLAPYSSGKVQANQALKNLVSLMRPSQKTSPATERLIFLASEKFQEMDATITLKRQGGDAEALALLRSNRGKALMDEANVFISSLIRTADAGIADGETRQKAGLFDLRRIVLASAALILAVVVATYGMITAFTRRLGRAHDEVALLNSDLERRVQHRTSELSVARDRAELLLAEVNHRVANSLALVASMVGLQSRSAESAETKVALSETQARITAVALVHKKLYLSGDVHSVALEEFLASLLQQVEVSMRDAGHTASLKAELASLKMPTDKSVSVGVIAAEWVTNAFKYAYPAASGEIRVFLKHVGQGRAELVVEDDGVGFQADQRPQGTGLGTKLVSALAASLGASVDYIDRRPGLSARLTLPSN